MSFFDRLFRRPAPAPELTPQEALNIPLPPAPVTPTTDVVHVGALPAIEVGTQCDRCTCSATIRVRLRKSGRRLDFCEWHYSIYSPALAHVVDAVLGAAEDTDEPTL